MGGFIFFRGVTIKLSAKQVWLDLIGGKVGGTDGLVVAVVVAA